MKVKPGSVWVPEAAPTFWLNHASRLLMRLFERRLAPLRLGVAYLPVVGLLERDETLLQKDLAERAHVEQPTMAALLARMERDGLIARRPHPDDRRKSRLALTARARERLPTARRALEEAAEQALTGFSERERATLLALCKRVVDNLTPDDERDAGGVES